MFRRTLVGMAAAIAVCVGSANALAQLGNAFTYQGQLGNAGTPVSGNVDLEFQLFDAATGGAAVGSLVTAPNVAVSNGLFTTTVDAGVNPYTSFSPRWLQIRVRNPATTGAWVAMSARQPLTATPFSLATRGISVSDTGRVGVAGGIELPNTNAGAVGFNLNDTRSYDGKTAPFYGLVWRPDSTDGNFNAAWLSGYSGIKLFAEGVEPAMVIRRGGNVGIGTTTPLALLSVGPGSNGDVNVPIQTSTAGPGTSRWVGINKNGGYGLLVGYDEAGNYAAIRQVTGDPLKFLVNNTTIAMTLLGNGNFGIGTDSPNQAKLVVNGSVDTSLTNARYIDSSGGVFGPFTNITPVSIYANQAVAANRLFIFSDARTKRIEGRSNAARDLETLLGVEVTDYTFKDTIAKGTQTQKKVIAQQVESVYPQAVSRITDIIPDIYKKAPVQGGWIMLETDLKVGDKVRLIGKDAQTESAVAEIKDGSFRVANLPAGDEVFVYGREVNDFRTVDYEAIAMLNVSATQELARQNLAMRKQIEALEAQVKSLSSDKNAALSARLEKLEALLAARETVAAK